MSDVSAAGDLHGRGTVRAASPHLAAASSASHSGCAIVRWYVRATPSALDQYLWHLTYRWARRSHQNKSRGWVATRYFGRFNKFRSDRWVFGDRDSGAYLIKFSWTDIVRHTLVQGGASPDDPALVSTGLNGDGDQTTTRWLHVAPAHQAGRTMPIVRRSSADRRSTTAVPSRMGTVVVAGHPQGDSRRLSPQYWGTWPTGRGPNPPRTHLLPPRAESPPAQRRSTAILLALAACLSRVPLEWHARFMAHLSTVSLCASRVSDR
jgi:hypothetical protein